MIRFQLQAKNGKRLNLHGQKKIKDDDVYTSVLIQLNGEQNEELALTLLLSTRDKENQKSNIINKNEWYNINKYFSSLPYTNEFILIWDNKKETVELITSFVFIQHYLMSKYYWGFKQRPSLKNITHFMIIGLPL